MVVYLDLVILLNAAVDFLLLLGTNRLTGFPAGFKRLIPAALLGGVYGGMCLLPNFHFLGNILWRLVCLGTMSVIAFGLDPSALRRCGVFVLLTMALGGVVSNFHSRNFAWIILGALCIWGLCKVGFGSGTVGRTYVPLQIHHDGKTVSLIALRDTGNTLKDPITGEQVLVLGGRAARELSGLTEDQLRSPLETMARQKQPGLRLIPYASVGQGRGMLLAMRFCDVKMGERSGSALIALAPETIGRGEGFQALAGGMA